MIDVSHNPHLIEGEAAFNSQLPQVSDSRSRILPAELSSRGVIIAEPLKEQTTNNKKPPQILDVITVVEDTVESTHRRNISDQENRIKPYMPNSFNKDECLKQMHILKQRLEKMYLQNMDLTTQNAKLHKKNESLSQKCEEIRHKKKYYKNQVQSQNQLLKDQMV